MAEHIYGIYPGIFLDEKEISAMQDWELFLKYYSITLLSWRINHDTRRDYSKGYVSDEEYDFHMRTLDIVQYSIEYLLYVIAKRNSIPVNEPTHGEHIKPDKETFMKWYNYYENHFMHEMSDSDWKEFQCKREQKQDVSEYLPDGNWRNAA